MNQFDEILKKRAREEPFPLPQGYAGRVLQTCAALEEPKPRKRYPFRQVTWAAAVLALMIVVPNVSPAAAAAMADVPVLGAIVRVITFRNYVYDDGFHSADISVPELGGDEAAQTVSHRPAYQAVSGDLRDHGRELRRPVRYQLRGNRQ